MIFINIGIDIGGSHVSMGLVDDEYKIHHRKDIFYTAETFEPEILFEVINDFMQENEGDVESIGIGIPGFATDTFINYACNLQLKNFEVTDFIRTSIPIYISNDANCATIAEYELVDHKMFSNYIFVTVGTGIGAGIILNGSLYTGSTGVAGEIGHMVIDKDGIPCKCGRRGCFEKYASVSALLKSTGAENLKEVFYLSEKNNNIQNVLDNYIENLSEGIANVVNMYDPEMLVIGGGLSEFSDEFLYKLKSKIYSKLYNKDAHELSIKSATMLNDAGIIGASILNKYL